METKEKEERAGKIKAEASMRQHETSVAILADQSSPSVQAQTLLSDMIDSAVTRQV